MTKKKRTYTPEFKADAVKLSKANGISKTAVDLGLAPVTIRNWMKSSEGLDATSEETDWKKEAKRLKKENQYLKEINEVLKKSTAIFSQEKFPPFK